MAGDELLSAFKVASFAFDEEKAVMEVKKENAEEESKDWVCINKIILQILKVFYKKELTKSYYFFQDDIIPENVRNTIAEQEKNKEMEDLYLPPRRKNLQQNNADNSK